MDKTEFAANTNSYITDYIKLADVKAGALLTLSSLLAAGVGRLTISLFDALEGHNACWYYCAFIVILGFVVSLAGTLWKSLQALNPNVEKTEADSLHSFPDIAERSYEDYIQASQELSCKAIASHFCTHNWTLSRIANAKFKALQRAICWLRLTIATALILVILYCLLALTANLKGETKCLQGETKCLRDDKKLSIITSNKVVS